MKLARNKKLHDIRTNWLWRNVREGRRLLLRDARRVAKTFTAPTQYICRRVKDGTEVSTFGRRDEALALLKKQYKQKKAKLEVLNTRTGELEPFTSDEMFD